MCDKFTDVLKCIELRPRTGGVAEFSFPASAVAQVDRLSEENPDLSQSFALLVNDMLNDFPVPEYRDTFNSRVCI